MESDLFKHISEAGLIAMDEQIDNKRVKRLVNEAKRKITRNPYRYKEIDPKRIENDIENYVSISLGTWIANLSMAVKKACKAYARTVAREVSADQRRVLTASGIPEGLIKERWTVPVVRGVYVSEGALKLMPQMIENATDQIVIGYARGIERVQEVLLEGLVRGEDIRSLSRAIALVEAPERKRSEFDALSVSLNFNQQIQRENSKAIGITKGIWVHVAGAYTSRKTHKEFNGQEFDLDKGLYDKDYGGYVLPAQLRFCRCQYRQVLPKWLTE